MKVKIGRPTKYKLKYRQIAYDLLSKGYSKTALAGHFGVSKQCFYEWVQKYEDFGDAVQRGVAASQLFWEELGMRGVQGEIKGFNATTWMFNMKNRFGWGEKDNQEIDEPKQPIMIVSYKDVVYDAEKQVRLIKPLTSTTQS